MLNTQSPYPLYHQLAEIITSKIRSGKYKPGETIPSENQLKNKYKIGRPTVRQAMDILVKNNLVYRKKGAGTFVREQAREVDLFSLAGTSIAFKTKGISIETTILENISQTQVKNDIDNPFLHREAFFISRLTKAETDPVVIEEIYFHPTLFFGIDNFDLAGKSLSNVVAEQFGLRPEKGRQTFKIALLSDKEAEILNLDTRQPILEVKRTMDFPMAEQAVYSRLLCRTDKFVFSQTILESRYI